MKQTSLTVFLGLLIALPLIAILELRGVGPIGLIWLISSGLVALVIFIVKTIRKRH